MSTTIGVYSIYDLAQKALLRLNDFGYTGANMTLMGILPPKDFENTLNLNQESQLNPVWYGADPLFRTTFGTLKRVGILALPGKGFLFGAGALAGMIAGFDLGLIDAGISIIFDTLGLKHANSGRYQENLLSGKYLVIVEGNEEELRKSKSILHIHGTYETLS